MSTTESSIKARRLRIAFVVHDYNRKFGHSRYVAELASRLRHEHEVHIFANTFEGTDNDGLTLHHVPAWRVNVVATLLTFLLPATWMVRCGKFDIIHAQGVCGMKHNVVTAHICQSAWVAAMAGHSGPPGWRKRLFHWLACRLERSTFRNGGAARFIAVSERIRTDLRDCYHCTDGVRVVYHGVDTEIFHPRNRETWRQVIRREIGIAETVPLALYVGELQKAFPAAVRGVARVPGLHLAAVSRSSATSYQPLIQELGIADRVHLLPASENVERYYAAADMFVFPSFYDSFGLVVTEAMASGLPVVCSDNAGASELITDGVDGIIVHDSWDPGVLAVPLERLVADPALRARLGGAARKRVEHQTWDDVARQTLAIYREICG